MYNKKYKTKSFKEQIKEKGEKSMQTTIFCRTKFEGVHCYPDAPAEVHFLRSMHRHMFNIEVEMDVMHDDREVEFITLKHDVNDWVRERLDDKGIWHMNTLSCEQVARMLMQHLEAKYGNDRCTIITVDEDGENGATVYED